MKKIQLFCIPYAGGSASFFHGLESFLGDTVDFHALEYAGHGRRRKEPFYKNFEELLEETACQIKEKRDLNLNYMLFGYSLGSLAVCEQAARYLKQDPPAHIFLAAHEPPHLPFRGKQYALLNDEDFLKAMEHFGGMDERVLNNKRFLDIFLPPMRADYRYLHEYEWDGQYEKMSCDITVFYSPEDTKVEDMKQWKLHTAGKTELIEYSGNHFFLKNHEEEIAKEILNTVLRSE